MPKSSKAKAAQGGAETRQSSYRKLGLFDVSFVFNLIQHMAHEGEVTNLYLQIPYQIGVAKQLFSILLLGSIKLPDSVRYRANLQIIWQHGRRAGFWIEREMQPGSFAYDRELYLFGLCEDAKQGSDKEALQYILSNLPANCRMHTDFFPQSYSMRRLFTACGFKPKHVSKQLNGKLHSYVYQSVANIKIS